MRYRSVVLALSLSLLLPACRKSEVTDKPAAAVTETTSTTATDALATPATGGVTANVIKEKSRIEFVAAKVTRDHHGGFRNFDGTIEYAGNKPAKINFTIDLDSVFTDTDRLTGHLKTPDFFDVAKNPKATFTSASLAEAPGSPNGATHVLTGVLDLHGMQKTVTIPVKAGVTADGVHTTSEFTINRQDWGIQYPGAPDDLIKDDVLIKLDLWFPPPPAA